MEKNTYNRAKLSRTKELRGKTGVLVGLDLPSAAGELKQGSDPHSRAVVGVRGETFNVESETAVPWQPKRNENHTVLATAIHMTGRNMGLLEGAVTGSWSLGIVEQSKGEGCCCLQRDGCRGCEGGDLGGNACGGKPGSHGSEGILLSHT